MNNRSIALFASTLLATSASLAVDSFKPALANTTFQCVTNTSQGGYSTIAIRSNGTPTSPLFNWRRQDFAPSGYTPQRRCDEVTRRLNYAVSQNGGLLSQLWLTTGKVNALPVVCYIRGGDSGCNGSNILYTISNPDHRRNPNTALTSLVNFSLTGAGSAIEETSGQQYVSLEKLVEAGVNANQNSSPPQVTQPTPVQPSIPTTPANPPANTSPTTPASNGGGI